MQSLVYACSAWAPPIRRNWETRSGSTKGLPASSPHSSEKTLSVGDMQQHLNRSCLKTEHNVMVYKIAKYP